MPLLLPFGLGRLTRLTILLLVTAGALSACSSQGREPRPGDARAQRRPANPSSPAASRPLIDLPAALHLRPAGFRARFGPPQPLRPDFVDPAKALETYQPAADSVVLFQPQGLSMVVSFRPGAGLVQDVLLLGPDEATLMRQAALRPAAPDYLLLPVFEDRRTDRLLGLRVVPRL